MSARSNALPGGAMPLLRTALVAAALLPSLAGRAADGATASATANVVEPITISTRSALAFGSFAYGDTQGTVTVSTAGALSTDGGVSRASGQPMAATFAITGAPGTTFRLATTVVALSDGKGNTMPLELIGDFDGAGATTPGVPQTGTLSGGSQTLHLGARLQVGAGQPPGAYSGQVGVEVSYQ